MNVPARNLFTVSVLLLASGASRAQCPADDPNEPNDDCDRNGRSDAC